MQQHVAEASRRTLQWSFLDLALPFIVLSCSNSVLCKDFYSGTESRQLSCFIPDLQSDDAHWKSYWERIIQCSKESSSYSFQTSVLK